MALPLGLLIGLILGLTGAGGSAFALPLLILVLNLPVQEAIGLSLATVALTAMYGGWRRMQIDTIAWRAVLFISAGGVMTAPVGKYLAGFVDDAWLLTGFTGLSVAVAVHMLRMPQCDGESALPPVTALRALPLAVAGMGVGFLAGMFGVGGGFIVVPLLNLIWRIPLRLAIATSLCIIAIISSVGFLAHAVLNPINDYPTLILLLCGGIVGMFSGCKLTEYISIHALPRYFAGALITLSGVTLTQAWL